MYIGDTGFGLTGVPVWLAAVVGVTTGVVIWRLYRWADRKSRQELTPFRMPPNTHQRPNRPGTGVDDTSLSSNHMARLRAKRQTIR